MTDDRAPAIEAPVSIQPEDRQQSWDDLLSGVRRSVLYHRHRQRHFDNLNRWKTAITLLSGSAAMVTILAHLKNDLWPLAASALVTVVSTAELVIGTTAKARVHADLARRFLELECSMTLVQHPTHVDLQKYTADRLLIEADELPILRILDVLCHNELMLAYGYEWDELIYVSRWQRFWAPMCSMPNKVTTQTIRQRRNSRSNKTI